MKYFKPELIQRYRSLDDDTAEAAAAEWEVAISAYRSRYRRIRDKLPRNVRLLRSKIAFHDSKILGVAIHENKPLFSSLIQLEGTPDDRRNGSRNQ